MSELVIKMSKLTFGDAGVKEEEGVVVNTLKEEAYHILACLYRKRKDFPAIGFNPDFLRATFGPLLFNKLSRCDGDIREAVDLWCSDPAAAEKTYGHISQWDVSRVTNMNKLFYEKRHFDEDISAWDTSNVTKMGGMFCNAAAFNQPIGGWDVSSMEEMCCMFFDARAFNQPIGDWDVSHIMNMDSMFYGARVFNQNIGAWNVSRVTNMRYIFSGARGFNQDISAWNVSQVTNMTGMFYGASAFNLDVVDRWDTPSLEHM